MRLPVRTRPTPTHEGGRMDIDKLERLLVEGARIDGSHHKQWYLMQALKIVSPESFQYEIVTETEPGVAP